VMRAMACTAHGARPDADWYRAFARAMRAAYGERLSGLGASTAEPGETCTTHLSVTDAEGTMVSVTTTLLSSMGSRVVLPRTGVLMNNGVMWFDPEPGSANAIRPGARPLCNMCPVTVSARDGTGPVMATGASGGRRILAAVYQTLALNLDFGMAPEEAAAFPRIDVSGMEGATADRRLDAASLEALAADGALEVVEHTTLPVNFACPNAIRRVGGDAVGISDMMSPWSAAVAARG